MTIKKNFFIKFSIFLAAAVLVHIFILAVTEFQARESEQYVSQAVITFSLILSLPVMYLLNFLSAKLAAHLGKALKLIIELALLLIIAAAGLYLRLLVIKAYPLAMESDYKFYYDVAVMLKNGTILTQSNNEYISLFPNTFGYSFVLSLVLRIFGEKPQLPLYFNAVISAGAAVISYYIGKLLFGRRIGLIVLVLSIFIPSQILYSSVNGSEALFTFFVYLAALLILYVQKKYNPESASVVNIILLFFLCGALIAVAAAARPMGLILLIAVIISLLSTSEKLDSRILGKKTFVYIYMSRGWLKASTVVIAYLLLTVLINTGIKGTIDKDISTAAGYSLLVGLDIEHDGGYSEESMNYLYDTYRQTGNPNAANQACLDLALERVKQNPVGILKLFTKKISLLWADDQYGVTTNYVTLENQRLLTTQRLNQLNALSKYSNLYYIFLLFYSCVGAVLLLLKKERSNVYLIVIFFIGTFALHLLVEVQNRYHYYILNSFAILAAAGIYLLKKDEQKEKEAIYASEPIEEAAAIPVSDSRESHLGFDIQKAIEEGHITVAVSEAYTGNKNEYEEKT